MVLWCTDRGADVDHGEPQSGGTPLHAAAASGRTEMCQLLLSEECGSEALNRKGGSMEQTPLFYAKENGHNATADWLESAGGEIWEDKKKKKR